MLTVRDFNLFWFVFVLSKYNSVERQTSVESKSHYYDYDQIRSKDKFLFIRLLVKYVMLLWKRKLWLFYFFTDMKIRIL